MKELSNRSADFTDSVIRRMTRVANKYGAVNLSQGFPDFDPPEEITDRLAEVAKEGPHQYALTWGAKNFRDAIADKYEHFSGLKVDPESEIVVTCGSTEAMMATMLSITNPGDKVVIFSPFYENYGADTILSGAEPVYVPLVPPEFTFDAANASSSFAVIWRMFSSRTCFTSVNTASSISSGVTISFIFANSSSGTAQLSYVCFGFPTSATI